MRTAAIILARAEGAGLSEVLSAIPPGHLNEIVVVSRDFAEESPDGSEVAREHGATLVRDAGRGYGRRCLAGLARLAGRPPEVVVFLDDASDDPRELPAVLAPLLSEGVDFVVGSRVRGEPPRRARFGIRLATGIIRFRTGYRFTDFGSFRAIRWRTLTGLGMSDPDYGWNAEMQLKAARTGVPSAEVPVAQTTSDARGSRFTGALASIKTLLSVLAPAPTPKPATTD